MIPRGECKHADNDHQYTAYESSHVVHDRSAVKSSEKGIPMARALLAIFDVFVLYQVYSKSPHGATLVVISTSGLLY